MELKKLLRDKIMPTKQISPAGSYLFDVIDEHEIKNINDLLDFLHQDWELLHKKLISQATIGAGGSANRTRKKEAETLKIISDALKILDESL